MPIIACLECQMEISGTAKSCPQCSCYLKGVKFCRFCGAKISAESAICVK